MPVVDYQGEEGSSDSMGISVALFAPYNASVRCHVRNQAGAKSTADTGPSQVKDGQWHHYVCTWDGSNIRLYIDGDLLKTEPRTGTSLGTVWPSTTRKLVLGGNWGGAGYRNSLRTAWLDDVRIYAVTLSNSDVAAVYAGGAGTCGDSTAGLFGAWRLDETNGSDPSTRGGRPSRSSRRSH